MEITLAPTISVRECLRFGWETFKKRPFPFVAAVIVLDALRFLSDYFGPSATFSDLASVAWLVLSIVVLVVVQVVIMTSFMLRAHDNPEAVGVSNLFYAANGWKLLGVSLLSLLAVVIGFILLIVPGIIVALVLAFSGYLAIEGRSPVEAMRESAALTKGNRFKLFLIGLVMLGSVLFSLLFLPLGDTASYIAEFVANLVVIPVVGLAFAHAYRLLQQAKKPEVVSA